MNLAPFLTTRLCKTARWFCSGSRKEGITECDATKVIVDNNCNPYSPASVAPINSPVNMSLAPPGYYPPSGYPPDFPASIANVMNLYNSSDSSGGGGSRYYQYMYISTTNATHSTTPDNNTKYNKNANTTTTNNNDANSSSKVKSDIEIEKSSINNNNRTTAIHHLKSARQRTLIVT